MNEQRLVTSILVVLLVLGAAGIVAVYFTTYDRMQILPGPASPARKEADTDEKTAKKSLSHSDNRARGDVNAPADRPGKGVATEPENKEVSPGQSTTGLTGSESNEKTAVKEVPLSRFAGSHDAIALKNQSGKDTETPPAESTAMTNHETSKSNGSFNTAQRITEGIIIGKRGETGDRSDFYKVRVTGKSMVLRLEPVFRNQNQRIAMTVFDGNRKPVGQDSGKNGSEISLEVNPEATYYIKLDLRHAPVKKSQYKLNVKFE